MKKFLAIIFGLIIFTNAIDCSAAISPNRFFLGGLTLEQDIHKINSMYGTAARTETDERLTFYYYGDESFCVVELAGRIFAVYSNDNNEIATPDGVTVGMAEQTIFDIYGESDGKNVFDDGLTEYIYNKYGRRYEELKFSVRNEKIVKISLRYNI